MKMIKKEFSSFRDNFGYVYFEKNEIFRLINKENSKNFNFFINSGLSQYLIEKNLLIDFQIIDDSNNVVLKPTKIPFISYPHEWSFSMYKDAALLTLKIQKIALEYGMTLRDASAYNVQFYLGKPIFIDITSFEINVKFSPWSAYLQFCKHFLSPLVLMAKVDVSLNKLMAIHLDGIPLNLTSKLLPWTCKFNLSIFLHIMLHQKFTKKYEKKDIAEKKDARINQYSITNNLTDFINSLNYQSKDTEWVNYYQNSVEAEYLKNKTQFFDNIFQNLDCKKYWDIGTNDGTFCEIASKYVKDTVASDIDPAAIENLYLKSKQKKIPNILPLILDITNTGGGFGWENLERKSIFERINADTISALALVHHLRITFLIPLSYIATFFAKNCINLIIEFVPKTDEKVKFLLQNREDNFDDYSVENFTRTFEEHFKIVQSQIIKPTQRILFLMKLK